MTIADLMQKLQRLFPRQFANEETFREWGLEYRRSLERFQGDKLLRAWTLTMDGWELRSAPTPGEILKHIAKDEKASGGMTADQIAWRQRDKAVWDLMHGELGRIATEEGWAGWLDADFRGGLEPHECMDINEVRRKHDRDMAAFEKALSQVTDDGLFPLRSFGESMVARAAERQAYWEGQHNVSMRKQA